MCTNIQHLSCSYSSGRRGLKENIIAAWWEKIPSHCRAPRNSYRTWLNVLLSLCHCVQIVQEGANGHHGMKVTGLATITYMQSPVSCRAGWCHHSYHLHPPNLSCPIWLHQELEYLNTKPQMTALIDMSFSDLMSLKTILSPLSLVKLGAKTLKNEFCLIGSEFGILFAVLIL